MMADEDGEAQGGVGEDGKAQGAARREKPGDGDTGEGDTIGDIP